MNNSDIQSVRSSYDYLQNEWSERLKDDNEKDDEWSAWCLNATGRNAAWGAARIFRAGGDPGIPAQAIRLLERYLAAHSRRTLRALHSAAGGDKQEVIRLWKSWRLRSSERIPLLLASCVQLAGKMTGGVLSQLAAGKVCETLAKNRLYYPVEDVIASEFAVFRTLGFRVPLWSIMDIGSFLCSLAGIELEHENLISTLTLAELSRSTIEAKLRWIAGLNESEQSSLRMPVLCAGGILAAVRITCKSDKYKNKEEVLTSIVKAPPTLISVVANVIVGIALE